MISIVESNGDSIVNDFKIILNDNGEYAYSMTSEVQRLRFLADVFGKATIDKLSNKQKAYSAADLMHYLCTDETYGRTEAVKRRNPEVGNNPVFHGTESLSEVCGYNDCK